MKIIGLTIVLLLFDKCFCGRHNEILKAIHDKLNLCTTCGFNQTDKATDETLEINEENVDNKSRQGRMVSKFYNYIIFK